MGKKRYFVLIGLVLFALILLNLDLNALAAVILNANPSYLLIALALVALTLVGKGLKWMLIIRAGGKQCPLPESTKLFCIGFFLSLLTPGRIGDLARALYLRDRMPAGSALSTVIVDRLIDIVIILLLSLFSVIGFAYLFGIVVVPPEIVLAIMAVFFLSAGFFMRKKYATLVLRPFYNMFIPPRLKETFRLNFRSFYASLKELRNSKLNLMLSVTLGFANWLISIATGYFIALSLGINVPFFFFILLIPMLSLIELLPISVSGIGTRDAGAIFLFSFYSVSAEPAVAFSLLYLVLAYFSVALIGALLFMLNPLKLDMLKQKQ
jgi:uncharacterized protein (TIRG00374 family)